MAAELAVAPYSGATRRWLAAVLALTVAPMIAAVFLAPAAGARPGPALVWLLFVGSSAHVGATAWFYTVPEVRGHMRRHLGRYAWAPILLVLAGGAAVVVAPDPVVVEALLAYFAWQFVHFQKQNLGLAALAARALGVPTLTRLERRALIAAGVGGVVALIAHPALLQLSPGLSLTWLYAAGGALFAGSVLTGALAVMRRPPAHRPSAFVAVYAVSLLFFAPVFCFASPYAAVAGLTMAHGLQYLLLVGLLAGAPAGSGRQAGSPQVAVLILVNIALVAGLALNEASHLHTAHGLARGIYGAYLGLVMAHFVIDAGLWRLRDEFPRTFLAQRLPYLIELD